MKRLALVTFGCQMNVHDSQRMEEILRRDGYTLVERTDDADVVVLNTCSVREKAEQKLRSEAGRLKHSNALLVVAGCVAQQEGEALLRRMPFIDAVVGPDNLAELPEILRELEGGAPPVARTVFDLDAPRFLANAAAPGEVGASAYVTTMKGCDERCSFCIVPYTRGAERYRPADDIVAEISALVAAGAREVVLLGQTVNSYREPGRDAASPTDAEETPDESEFPALLARIAREVPGLLRLRYTSPHPRHVTPALVRAHGEIDVLAEHVHLPVQSGCDRTLKRMIRRYTRAEYVARADALRGARAGLTLSTDVIVGFPGETRDEFDQTLALVREVGFVGLFGFKYSPRPHTPALRLRDDVPEAEKQDRLLALFAVSEAQLRAHLATLVGTRQHVLLEGPSRPGATQLVGRTRRNEIVHVEGVPSAGPGALAVVEVVRANHHSLEGRVETVERTALTRPSPAATFRRVALPVVSA
jgi:tRNA-2-methylthio-N6-dimethylallyladenosine synthase